MLYWLLYQKLFPYFSFFRIFRFVTFRCVFASMTAMLIGLLLGPYVIDRLRQFQIGQYIREEGPQSHQKKGGTPTMGGVLICLSIIVPTLLWSNLSDPFVWLVMSSTIAFGAIGFADDYIKVVKKRNLGLTSKQKLFFQFLASGAVAVALLVLQSRRTYSTRLMVPFFKRFRPDLVWSWMGHIPHMHWLAYLPFVIFVMLVITFSSNAVNLTDGLDGLAIGCTIIAADKPDLPSPTTNTRLFFKSIMPSQSHRSFSVVNANRANTSAKIQNRVITFDSDHPPSSKW